ncbi:MAG: ATP-binding protein [Gemmatimonadaceae bacterium]
MAESGIHTESVPFQWDDVIQQLSDGVVVVARDGHAISINDSARLLLGLRTEAASLEEYWAGADVRAADGMPLSSDRWPVSRALRGDIILNEELRVARPDGSEVVISSSAVPLLGAHGEPWGAAVVLREITREARLRARLETDRVGAERRAREQAELAAAAGEIVGTLSVDELLARIARRAHTLSGGDYAAVAAVDERGASMWRAIDGNRTDAWRMATWEPGRGTAGRVIAADAPMIITGFPDNPEYPPEEFPAHVAEGMRTALGVPLRREGRPFGAVIVGWRRDAPVDEHTVSLVQTLADLAAVAVVNAQLVAEAGRRADEAEALNEELRQTSAELEAQAAELETQAAELQERNEELDHQVAERQRLVEQLTSAEGVKARFFAQMSHELRTPINAILGYSGLMAEGIGGELPPRAGEMLGRVQRSAQHLMELVNDVLDISRLEAGKVAIAPEEVDVVALARDALASVAPQAAAKGLALRVDGPARVAAYADPQRVRQILLNLLSNAVKFTDAGGITVEVVPPSDRERRVALCVTDTGIGIAPQDQERIFGEFEQVAGKGAASGTGLGLTITRRLARLQGGDVTVRSAPEGGSTFSVWLPAPR